jgi:hypothetical protein
MVRQKRKMALFIKPSRMIIKGSAYFRMRFLPEPGTVSPAYLTNAGPMKKMGKDNGSNDNTQKERH